MAVSQTDDFVLAAGEGKLLPMLKCLRKGIDVNQPDSKKRTALCQASAGGHYDICYKLLIENKADPNTIDGKGKSPIHYAAAGGQDKIVELLALNDADVNVVGEGKGWCPLHYAAQSGSLKSVRPLLRKGANVNSHTPNGNTAAHIVLLSQNYSQEVLEELCGWPGARPETTNDEDENVLDLAWKTENRAAIDFLTTIGRKCPFCSKYCFGIFFTCACMCCMFYSTINHPANQANP